MKTVLGWAALGAVLACAPVWSYVLFAILIYGVFFEPPSAT